MAALLLGWSVVVRYSNVFIALLFGLHFIISRAWGWERGRRRFILREALCFGAGALIPLLLLLGYQRMVFGSALCMILFSLLTRPPSEKTLEKYFPKQTT